MKKIFFIVLFISSYTLSAQSNSELKKHYEEFYKQMKTQGDFQGIINGLTHLNVIDPSTERKDTLAYLYMSEKKYSHALNTIGADVNASDSNLALEVKAVSLKAINQPELALPHFKEMFERKTDANVAYELAELNLTLQKFNEAKKYINYGVANATSEMKHAYYETQQPYQVSLKAAFLYLKAMVNFNENKTTNIDSTIAILDQALSLNPNFNLVQISKNALIAQKKQVGNKN